MKKNKFIILALIILLAGAGYYFHEDLGNLYQSTVAQFKKEVAQQKKFEPEVSLPSPLEGPTEEKPSNLTVSGVVEETNLHRKQNGLSELSVSPKLNRAAEIKVDDMFTRQYFEHESPTGEGPGDLAEEVDYQFLAVGENLALGNYENDKALVQAWMDSPGHRENILNDKYTEIGVAVKRGTYKGQTVWMAVQEFGRPASLCPTPSDPLKSQIDENKELLEELESELSAKRKEIEGMRRGRGSSYQQKVGEYRELTNQYNELSEEIKEDISLYNEQVNAYNKCIQ